MLEEKEDFACRPVQMTHYEKLDSPGGQPKGSTGGYGLRSRPWGQPGVGNGGQPGRSIQGDGPAGRSGGLAWGLGPGVGPGECSARSKQS